MLAVEKPVTFHLVGRKLIGVKQVLLASLGLLLTFITACTPSQTLNHSTPGKQDLLDILQSRGTLVIAAETDYPPQSQLIEGEPRLGTTRCQSTEYTANQLTGFDIEVAANIAGQLGVEPCFVTPGWSQIISGSWSDVWDVSVGSMVITPDRMKRLWFTQPYTSGSAVLFVHKDNQSFHQPSDLSGKRVGVCAGCAYEDYLNGRLVIPGQQIVFKIHGAEIVGYDTDTSALADLARGNGAHLDAVLTDPDTGEAEIANGLPIKQMSEPVYYDFVAAAVDKKGISDPLPFLEKLNQIIQGMHADGTLSRLSVQYYGSDFTTQAADFDIQALYQEQKK